MISACTFLSAGAPLPGSPLALPARAAPEFPGLGQRSLAWISSDCSRWAFSLSLSEGPSFLMFCYRRVCFHLPSLAGLVPFCIAHRKPTTVMAHDTHAKKQSLASSFRCRDVFLGSTSTATRTISRRVEMATFASCRTALPLPPDLE